MLHSDMLGLSNRRHNDRNIYSIMKTHVPEQNHDVTLLLHVKDACFFLFGFQVSFSNVKQFEVTEAPGTVLQPRRNRKNVNAKMTNICCCESLKKFSILVSWRPVY